MCSLASSPACAPAAAGQRIKFSSAPGVPRVSNRRFTLCSARSVETKVDGILRLELDTREAQASLKFEAVGSGKGQVIAVSTVAQGSEAWVRGVRRGHRLIAISDPVRSDEMWELGNLSSGRFVRDALKLRISSSIRMDIDTRFSEMDVLEGRLDAGALGGESTNGNSASSGTADALSSADRPATATSSFLDAVTSSAESASDQEDDGPQTVAQRLEDRYRRQQDMAKRKTPVQRRIAARTEYLSQVSNRNDAPFFSWVAAFVLVPPFAILAWAYASGYLDQLSRGYGP